MEVPPVWRTGGFCVIFWHFLVHFWDLHRLGDPCRSPCRWGCGSVGVPWWAVQWYTISPLWNSIQETGRGRPFFSSFLKAFSKKGENQWFKILKKTSTTWLSILNIVMSRSSQTPPGERCAPVPRLYNWGRDTQGSTTEHVGPPRVDVSP